MKKITDSGQKYSHKIDNKILQVQADLAKSVAEDTVTLGEFCDTVDDLENFVQMQAEFRADGFTKQEGGKLLAAFRERGKDQPSKLDPRLKSLYQLTQAGKLKPDELTEELNWNTQQAYGAIVADRPGPVYAEERYKLRAHLHLSRSEKKKAEKKNYIHPDFPHLVQKAIDLFPSLDDNGDGVVNRLEARSLLTDYRKLGLTPAESATLYSRQQELASAVDPEKSGEDLKMEDLEILLPNKFPKKPGQELLDTVSKVSKRLAYQEKIDTPEPGPFKTDELFQPWNVKQGLEGSCWLLSNLPTLTDEDLNEIIHPEGDGYRVTLADGRSTFVEPLNEAERRVYSKGDGAWSGLLEKGLSQLLKQESKDLNGGFAKDARRMLTGKISERHRMNTAPEDGSPDLRDREVLFETLEQAFRNGSAVFAATDKDDHEKGVSEISASKHAYTVLDVNRDTDTVVVRNPWGRNERADLDEANNGVFELTQDQFFANFSYLYMDRQSA